MTDEIAVSLPDDLVGAAREKVANGEFDSVATCITDFVQRTFAGVTLQDVLDEWFAETGEPSAEDYAWADRALGLTDG